ncbi:hypothetical protein ABZT45_36645 [Streptomyces sp. NPDC005356]|uniref:hypothetical protein n=1 Tax=unclassified Streptomyces TaxID=2593676 RepID=UPI0033A357F2
MSALCDHRRPDYHHDGETCRLAADLKPGDQGGVVTGAHVTVLEVHPDIEPGRTSVLMGRNRAWGAGLVLAVPSEP